MGDEILNNRLFREHILYLTRKISVEDKIYAIHLYLDGKEYKHRIAPVLMSAWPLSSNGSVIMVLAEQRHLP